MSHWVETANSYAMIGRMQRIQAWHDNLLSCKANEKRVQLWLSATATPACKKWILKRKNKI
jgi:hypothetical protein